jgi:hypothetical protein
LPAVFSQADDVDDASLFRASRFGSADDACGQQQWCLHLTEAPGKFILNRRSATF